MTKSAHQYRKTLLSLTVFGAILGSSFTVSVAQTSANSINAQVFSQVISHVKDTAVLEDGIYLFGQSPQRDQLGTSYAIFTVADNQTIGAFYQPSSSFDCFYGQVHPDRIALNVVDSYEQIVHPYAIALTTDGSLTAGSAAPAYTLQGFHRIEAITDQDLHILAVCVADFDS
ncbi:hypothetical protein S7335_2083 [Synechococcus sp. PCC 7335]|uniref:hypothetical protein n=1 Tax=Synechococcus sp. (strain ATCC 29403 / PCC 7335) TaxID=91464 RepID=UPI00017EDD4F|nr:hypothetical protein [Synechococcus sp. PCC 7335]EDX84386.1 hypothetical protein S7335_2083 [Synechococcus sp. PCC 7335]